MSLLDSSGKGRLCVLIVLAVWQTEVEDSLAVKWMEEELN